MFYGGLWWFVTHVMVNDRGPVRRYTHRLVAMDEGLTEIRQTSPPFCFEPDGDLEYCLDFRLDAGGTATFAYSVRDRLPRTLEVSLDALIQDVGT